MEPLLIFAHRLEELLFDYTLDSYKARALNLHTTLIELGYLGREARAERVHTGALIPVLEELRERVKTDPVLNARERAYFESYCDQLAEDRTSPKRLVSLVRAWIVEIRDFYWERLREEIVRAVTEPAGSRHICALADVFVAEAEIAGFSRSYQYYSTRKAFWRTRVDDPSAVVSFLDRFDAPARNWTFIFKAAQSVGDFVPYQDDFAVSIRSEPPHIDDPRPWVDDFLHKEDEFPWFVVVEDVQHREPVGARNQAEGLIEILADVYSYFVPQQNVRWKAQCLCLREDGTPEAILKRPSLPMQRRAHAEIAGSEALVRDMIEVMKGAHYTRSSTRLYHRALDYHRAAAEARTPENQLLDLWAAVEGFLPPPGGESNRISHYVATLLPALVLGYPEKLFGYLQQAIENCGAPIVSLVDKAPGDTLFEKTVAITVADDLKAERSSLLEALGDHPLLRYRVFEMHERFRTSKRLRQTLLDHKRRVSWHIQRVYSTRNQIVHSARALPYLDTLVENLRNYLSELLKAVAIVGSQAREITTVEAAIQLLAMHERNLIRSTEGAKVRFTVSNYQKGLFGDMNPLSPFHDRFGVNRPEGTPETTAGA